MLPYLQPGHTQGGKKVLSAGEVARGGVNSQARELVLENGAANVHRVGALRNNDALCTQSETGGWEKQKQEQEQEQVEEWSWGEGTCTLLLEDRLDKRQRVVIVHGHRCIRGECGHGLSI